MSADDDEQLAAVAEEEGAEQPEQHQRTSSRPGSSAGLVGAVGCVDADAVEEQRHDLGGRERLVEDQRRVGARDRQPAQQVRGLERVAPDLVAVGFEQRGEPA